MSDWMFFLFDQLEISSDAEECAAAPCVKVCVKSKQTVGPMPHSLLTSCSEAPGHLDVWSVSHHAKTPAPPKRDYS